MRLPGRSWTSYDAVARSGLRLAMLEPARPGVLTTLRMNGAPASSPVWFDWFEDGVLMNTRVGREKLANVASNPWVSLCVLGPRDDEYATVEGWAHWFPDPGPGIERLAERYGADPAKFAGQDRAVIDLQPVRVLRHG